MKKISLCLMALSLCGCSDVENDWEHEILLYLFKSRDIAVDLLTLTCQHEGEEQKTLRDLELTFADCESNRVRIIPKSNTPLTVRVECQNKEVCDVQEKVIEAPMNTNTVSLILTNAPLEQTVIADLVPTGDCGPPDIKAPPKTALGESCINKADCEGGVCLTSLIHYTSTLIFKNGYCSSSCEMKTSDCGDMNGECYEFQAASNSSSYCLKKCAQSTDCRTTEGYTCQNEQYCLPPQAK